MTKEQFMGIYEALMSAGYEKEIDWSENLSSCQSGEQFLKEYTWVVLNSGMKNQVARKIYERINRALSEGISISTVFNHKGKLKAIIDMNRDYNEVFKKYLKAKDKLKFLESLPYIGKITKYHLAKNLGMDICKPDRHLVRIASQYCTTPLELCKKLSKATGLRISTVDVVIWRAANLRII